MDRMVRRSLFLKIRLDKRFFFITPIVVPINAHQKTSHMNIGNELGFLVVFFNVFSLITM